MSERGPPPSGRALSPVALAAGQPNAWRGHGAMSVAKCCGASPLGSGMPHLTAPISDTEALGLRVPRPTLNIGSGMVAVPGGAQMRRGINKLFFLPLAAMLVLAAFGVGTLLATVLPLPELLTWWH